MANSPVLIYTTQYCPFCIRAKMLLDHKGAEYEEIAVDTDAGKRREMMEKSRQRTVPQIWIADEHVGGCDELFMLERQGKLDGLLNP